MTYCRACQREHTGPECPVNEQGQPAPPSNLAPWVQATAPTWYAAATFTSNTASSGYTATVTYPHSDAPAR